MIVEKSKLKIHILNKKFKIILSPPLFYYIIIEPKFKEKKINATIK